MHCAKKNTMKNLFTFLLFLSTAGIVNAQTAGQVANYGAAGSGNNASVGQLNTILGSVNDANKRLKYANTDIQGSPYSTEVFLPTQLFYGDENMGNMFYRYNAYNEEIEIKQTTLESEGIRSLARDKKISIVVNGQPMSFITFIDKKGTTQNGYLTKLSDGKYSLYRRTDVKYTEGQKAQNSFVKAIPARFSKFTEFYLGIEGVNRIDELELKNRKLIKIVPDDKKEALKVYLKENNIRINNEASVIKVLDFLNQE